MSLKDSWVVPKNIYSLFTKDLFFLSFPLKLSHLYKTYFHGNLSQTNCTLLILTLLALYHAVSEGCSKDL